MTETPRPTPEDRPAIADTSRSAPRDPWGSDTGVGTGDEARAPRPNRRFVLWATGGLVAGVVLFLLAARLPVFGEGFHAVFAISLGVGFTILVSVALMALVFHSARSGHDEEVEGDDPSSG